MPTLRDIQEVVNEALKKIQSGDSENVRTVLWPRIKSMIPQCTDLKWIYRRDMGLLVYKRLNEQGLHAPPTEINLMSLKADLEKGKVKVSELREIPSWIPW